MIANTLAALGGAALLMWAGVLGMLVIPQTRSALAPWFAAKTNRGPGRIILEHALAATLGALALLMQVEFFREAGDIKHAVLPFGSAVLYMLMFCGVGSTLATSLALIGRAHTIGAYLAGHAALAYWIFSTPEFMAVVLFVPVGLLPFTLAALVMRAQQTRQRRAC